VGNISELGMAVDLRQKPLQTMPLLERFPQLAARLPYVSLGTFPTPLQRLERLGNDIGASRLFIKRDDLSGTVYGGNKTRKLEFLLGDALRRGAKEVLTFGYAGSNHCLATAVYARMLGMRSISMLMPQPNAPYVSRNLLMSHHEGAELHLHRNMPWLIFGTLCQLSLHGLRHRRVPSIIPPGGSTPPGVVGFVNAALELKEQIVRGEAPQPDRIYVAAGTMGTAAGLMLGLRAADLVSKVAAVAVAGERHVNARGMLRLIRRTEDLLCSLAPSFPRCGLTEADIDVRHGFAGQGYGTFTEEVVEAVVRMERSEGIKLEGTYTGKALAALIHDVKQQGDGSTILFWNTYNSRDFSEAAARVDYRELPRAFHGYFEGDLQPGSQYL
jgi:D-cysteine desulfhydrase